MLTPILTPSRQAMPSNPIHYPETDGEPMAETDFQYKYLTYCRDSLDLHFQADSQVYVSGNLLIYYDPNNARKSISPDVFVVLGVPKHDRPIYKIWEEGKAPDVVIEITSKSTETKDRVFKSSLYSRLGVKEYFMYDPTGDYLTPVLQGFWLDEDGSYQPIGAKIAENLLTLESYLLKLELHVSEGRLRLYDPDKQNYLLNRAEEQAARLQAEAQMQVAHQRAEEEHAARLQAEARVLELEARLRALEGRV